MKEAFSIITTKANSLLERIHNTRRRMSVILRQALEWASVDLLQVPVVPIR
jgi:putative SOS response-associated peptidase YedK